MFQSDAKRCQSNTVIGSKIDAVPQLMCVAVGNGWALLDTYEPSEYSWFNSFIGTRHTDCDGLGCIRCFDSGKMVVRLIRKFHSSKIVIPIKVWEVNNRISISVGAENQLFKFGSNLYRARDCIYDWAASGSQPYISLNKNFASISLEGRRVIEFE